MPYKSEAQRRFFNSSVGKQKIGKENVEQWNKESEGLKNLPEKVSDVKNIIDSALRMIDKVKVEICDLGDQNKITNWCVVDISNGRTLKDHFKNEKEATVWAKKQGYEV